MASELLILRGEQVRPQNRIRFQSNVTSTTKLDVIPAVTGCFSREIVWLPRSEIMRPHKSVSIKHAQVAAFVALLKWKSNNTVLLRCRFSQ